MQRVRDDLRNAGLTVWTDEGIEPGSPSWKMEIETAIENTGCIVVIFSPDAADSRWVRAELDFAETQKKPIYPILARGDEAQAVPFGFSTYQWIDVRDLDHYTLGIERLIEAIDNKVPLTKTAEKITALPRTRNRSQWLWVAAVPLLIILGIGGYLVFPRSLPPPIPENMQAAESGKVSLALPKNWTAVQDLSTIKPILRNAVGDAPDFDEFFDYAASNVDTAYINFMRLHGVFVFIENTGFEIDSTIQEARLNELWLNANMLPAETEMVDVPAGEMLRIKFTSLDEDVDGKGLVYSLSQGENWYVVGFLARNENSLTDLLPTIEAVINSFTIK